MQEEEEVEDIPTTVEGSLGSEGQPEEALLGQQPRPGRPPRDAGPQHAAPLRAWRWPSFPPPGPASPVESAPTAPAGGPLPRTMVQNLLLLSLKRDPGCVVLASILSASPGLLRQLVSALTLLMERESRSRAASESAGLAGVPPGELTHWRRALSASLEQPGKHDLSGNKRVRDAMTAFRDWAAATKKPAAGKALSAGGLVGGRRIQISPVPPAAGAQAPALHVSRLHGYTEDV
ncbi:hypothetical protein QBZ16_000770 [Prototheca wickerhamii]|uniref:Uncharacterized protein n=1 Tax=Prototheca wickerhamii TaxID=3111 RepID=A0AAD9ILY7_PROWI|nr:hypothetical protein QBZ16_000770 [Prototheca wickerhamii]